VPRLHSRRVFIGQQGQQEHTHARARQDFPNAKSERQIAIACLLSGDHRSGRVDRERVDRRVTPASRPFARTTATAFIRNSASTKTEETL
jgi:hypothetical protein